MSDLKRKVQFDENVKEGESSGAGDGVGEPERKTRFKEKHSLDSDEEDTSEKHKVMDDEDIEGQEATTIEVDEGITITPFNMREELEEGHFDTDGTYIFKKDAEVRDNWLDSVDWKPVQGRDFEEKDSDSEPDDVDVKASYKQVLDVLRPGETVTRALQRLGGSSTLSASERMRRKKAAKKAGTQPMEEGKEEEEKDNKALFNRLTELASALLQAGRDEVYQETYEKIKHTLEQASKCEASAGAAARDEAEDSDDALDMFGQDIDTDTHSKPESSSSAAAASTSSEVASGEVAWEYKWEDKDEIEVYGPYTSQQMADWQEEGFFKSGVFVRKVGVTDGRFYNSRRIDFELYI